jgi:zinc-ribbon domain
MAATSEPTAEAPEPIVMAAPSEPTAEVPEQIVMAAPDEPIAEAPEPIGPPPGVIRRLVGVEAAAEVQPSGRYCMTCGRKLLPGATFCTQCGMRSADDEAAAAALHEDGGHDGELPVEGVPAGTRFPRPGMPHLDLRASLNRVRVGYLGYIARHALRWDLAMAALSVMFVAFGAAGERLGGSVGEFLLFAQLALTVLFLAEYGTRLVASTDRRSFVIGHPAELVALAPQLRAVRVLALLRWAGIPALARRFTVRLTFLSARARRSTRYVLLGLWVTLVFLGVAMLYQYTSASPTAVDRLLAIAAGAFVVCMMSAVTAILTTSIVMARRAGSDDLVKRERILAELKDAGLLTQDASVGGSASILREPSRADETMARQQPNMDPIRPVSGLSPQR